MQKKRLKKSVIIFLPIIFLMGTIFFYNMVPVGKILNASMEKSLFRLTLNGEDITNNEPITGMDKVEVELTARETGIYKIPQNEADYHLELEKENLKIPYYMLDETEFDLENQIISSSLSKDNTETSSGVVVGTTEMIDSKLDKRVSNSESEANTPDSRIVLESAVINVRSNTSDGYYFLRMEKGESVIFTVQRLSSEKQDIILVDMSNQEKKQKIVAFKKKVEPMKKDSNKAIQKDADKAKQKGMDIDVGSLELRSEVDIVKLKDISLNVQTGEKNFDSDNLPGHDSSPSNDIVRTWDKVTYSYSFSVQSSDPSKSYKNIRYKVNASLKNARQVVDGQVRDYAYFPEGSLTGNNSSTIREANYETSGTLNSSSAIVDSSVNLQVLGATNDYELSPTITVTIIDAIDIETGMVVPINAVSNNLVNKSIKVSAKPNVKVELSNNTTVASLTSDLTDDLSTKSMSQQMGIMFSVIPLTDSGINRTGSLFEQLFGATYPVGEIKVEVETKAWFQPINGGSDHNIEYGVDQPPPQISHYGFLSDSSKNLDDWTKTPEFTTKSFKNLGLASGWVMPGSKDISTNKSSSKAVYDTNQLSAVNEDKKTFIFSVKNSAAIHKEGLISFIGSTEQNVNKTVFASIGTLLTLPYDYVVGKEGTIFTELKTTTIEYEGNKSANVSNIKFNRGNLLPGQIITRNPVYDLEGKKIGTNQIQSWLPSGDGAVYEGQKIDTVGIYSGESSELKYITGISTWNTSSFEYDDSRNVTTLIESATAEGKVKSILYGIRKNKSSAPNLTVRFPSMDAEYEWHSTSDEAKAKGKIAAVKTIFEKIGLSPRMTTRSYIPLKAIGPANNQAKDNEGNANVFLSSARTSNNLDEKLLSYPYEGLAYRPTEYDEQNEFSLEHSPANLYGDTVLIVPFTARVSKIPIRTSYNSDEVVQWKITPRISANSDESVTFTLKDTLPKELQYVSGSSKYGAQEIEPTKEKQSDGSTILTWTIPYKNNENPIRSLVFDSIVNGKNMKYDATNTKNVTNKVTITGVTESGLTDKSIEILRSAEASTTITKVSTTVIEKNTLSSKIEMGANDPATTDGEKNTTLRYSLYNKNESKNPSKETKILDVFPYLSDGRGTTYSGSFDLLSVNVKSINKPKIFYSKQAVSSSTDPNDIDTSSGWSVYTGGRIADVRAIYLEYDQLDVGEENTINFDLVAKNQKKRDILVNSAKLDNYNNSPVQSVYVKSTVVARSIKGISWYDDNLDGKKNYIESNAPNVPVKLYRTSHENISFKGELVKENLIGKKFVDVTGNSLIKTDSNGVYEFDNLPEGEYIVYFEIGDNVTAKKYKVTKKDGIPSSQALDTSKANIQTYKTDVYDTPTLTGGNFTDSEWKVENINIGLIRPSTIRLFKYATGSAIDANQDGKLSDAEKATGTPLSGAEFDLYKGNLEEKIGSAKTDETGNLEFSSLFEGDYTLVETKAPSGYELIKSPIKVTITEGNQTIKVYQEDDKKADLPFTGGNGPMFAILLAASGALILGFGYMLWYYRMPKRKGGR